jgi:Na+/alanine symporter
VATATALIILFSGVYTPGKTAAEGGASLTQAALTKEFGATGTWLMTVLVCVFAFSSVLGNYSYAEVNLNYLGASKAECLPAVMRGRPGVWGDSGRESGGWGWRVRPTCGGCGGCGR